MRLVIAAAAALIACASGAQAQNPTAVTFDLHDTLKKPSVEMPSQRLLQLPKLETSRQRLDVEGIYPIDDRRAYEIRGGIFAVEVPNYKKKFSNMAPDIEWHSAQIGGAGAGFRF